MTKRSKVALYAACAILPMALFVGVALWVYDGPCPNAGEVLTSTNIAGEKMQYCATKGIKHGPFSVVNSEGRRTAEGMHREGALHGSYRKYSEGVLVEARCYSNGQVMWTSRNLEEIKSRTCDDGDDGNDAEEGK